MREITYLCTAWDENFGRSNGISTVVIPISSPAVVIHYSLESSSLVAGSVIYRTVCGAHDIAADWIGVEARHFWGIPGCIPSVVHLAEPKCGRCTDHWASTGCSSVQNIERGQ